jgi:hypothetical protein
LAGLARKLAVLGPFDVALKKFPDSGGGEQESGPSDPIPRAQPAESPDELLSRKKKNVELLKDLLQTTLPEGAREHLVERLRKAYGYRGPDDYILCEYCLEEDPLKILVQEFRFDDLERVARDFGLELPTVADQHELARVILKDLGFAVPDTPKGIDAALRILRGHQKEFNCARSKEEIVGLAPRTNNELERILHGLIVFYGTVFFGVQFWDVFAEWNSRFRQQRQTLGMKFNILKKMEKEVLRDPTRATKLQELFGGRKYVIGKRELQECSDVVPFRSALSHFRDKIDSMPLSSAKKWVRPFFTETVDFVDYLHKNDIYPVTVVVAGRYEDAYGRKWVECITDAGHTEKIFTNKPMQRSSEYFMLPRTNPVRIYPILVEYQEAE